MAKSASYLAKSKAAKTKGLYGALTHLPKAASPGSHPTTDKHFFDHRISYPEKVDWMKSVTGASEYESDLMTQATYDYTGSYYDAIHDGSDTDRIQQIDKFLNNPNVPIYSGTTYRGVTIYPPKDKSKTAYEVARQLISADTWKEPGITSFSTEISIAKGFAGSSSNPAAKVGIVVVNEQNLSAVPVKHLSKFFGENEVLHPSSIKDRGFKIDHSRTHFDSSTNRFYIYVKENH